MKKYKESMKQLVLGKDKQYWQTLSQTNQKRENTQTNKIIYEK